MADQGQDPRATPPPKDTYTPPPTISPAIASPFTTGQSSTSKRPLYDADEAPHINKRPRSRSLDYFEKQSRMAQIADDIADLQESINITKPATAKQLKDLFVRIDLTQRVSASRREDPLEPQFPFPSNPQLREAREQIATLRKAISTGHEATKATLDAISKRIRDENAQLDQWIDDVNTGDISTFDGHLAHLQGCINKLTSVYRENRDSTQDLVRRIKQDVHALRIRPLVNPPA